jgi:uncharacterized membrane protein YdbT with pleckstrin-like domain
MPPDLRLVKGEGDAAVPLATFTHDARLNWLFAKILAALWVAGGIAAFVVTYDKSVQIFLATLAVAAAGCALWQVFAALAKGGYRYTLTKQRLDLERGLMSKRRESVELWRVRDVVLDQSVLDRMRGSGTMTIFSTDQVEPTLVVGPIADAQRNYEALRDATQAARRDGRVMTLQQ